jgi:hypothetical protein
MAGTPCGIYFIRVRNGGEYLPGLVIFLEDSFIKLVEPRQTGIGRTFKSGLTYLTKKKFSPMVTDEAIHP